MVAHTWRPRYQVRPLRSGAEGRRYFALGVRFGVWPCLAAPFVQLTLGFWRAEIWLGYPSYQPIRRAAPQRAATRNEESS